MDRSVPPTMGGLNPHLIPARHLYKPLDSIMEPDIAKWWQQYQAVSDAYVWSLWDAGRSCGSNGSDADH